MSEAEQHPEQLPPVPSEEEIAAELDEVHAAEEPHPRRYPSTIGGVFYLGVLAATMIGLGVVWAGDWRLGMRWVGGALLAAALLRLVLRTRDAGMLAVRHRVIDCFLLGSVGGVVIFLAQTIPDQPGF